MGRSRASPLPPKSPPTATTLTLICSSGSPRAWASCLRTRKGALLEHPDLDASVIIECDDARVGLEVALVAAGNGEGVLHYEVGLAKSQVQVSLGPGQARLAIVDVGGEASERGAVVGGGVVVEERGAGQHGLQRVEDGGQRFIVHVDEGRGPRQRPPGVGGNGGHAVTHVADAVPAEGRACPGGPCRRRGWGGRRR